MKSVLRLHLHFRGWLDALPLRQMVLLMAVIWQKCAKLALICLLVLMGKAAQAQAVESVYVLNQQAISNLAIGYNERNQRLYESYYIAPAIIGESLPGGLYNLVKDCFVRTQGRLQHEVLRDTLIYPYLYLPNRNIDENIFRRGEHNFPPGGGEGGEATWKQYIEYTNSAISLALNSYKQRLADGCRISPHGWEIGLALTRRYLSIGKNGTESFVNNIELDNMNRSRSSISHRRLADWLMGRLNNSLPGYGEVIIITSSDDPAPMKFRSGEQAAMSVSTTGKLFGPKCQAGKI